MIWTLLTGALGAGAVFYMLWRKSRVENERDVWRNLAKSWEAAATDANRAVIDNAKTYGDQMHRLEAVITQLKAEREALNATLESLPTGAVRNSLLRTLGIVPDDSYPLMDPRDL